MVGGVRSGLGAFGAGWGRSGVVGGVRAWLGAAPAAVGGGSSGDAAILGAPRVSGSKKAPEHSKNATNTPVPIQ